MYRRFKMRRMKPIININDVELKPNPFPPTKETKKPFGGKMGWIGPVIGAQKLGCNVTAVEPGKRVFPFHTHRVNEEMFFILEGEGEVRIGPETYPVRKGDIIACPPGGTETAHQIINTGSEELRYLAVSTKEAVDLCHYPDTGKFGVLTDDFRFVGRADQSLDYWEGE
jgi:uncharacterized cupin superfamily protein